MEQYKNAPERGVFVYTNGLLIAFLAAMIDGTIKIFNSGAVFDWTHPNPAVIAGISAALSYLLKSLAANSYNKIFTRKPI